MYSTPFSGRGRRWALLLGLLAAGSGCGGGEPGEGQDAYDVLRYDLSGHYDWEQNRLIAQVAITLRTTAPDVQAVKLDSQVTEVKRVHSPAGNIAYSVDEEAGTLTVDLTELRGEDAQAPVTFWVDYEAEPGDSLRAVPPRRGDPVASPAVFTDSEPLRASQWLPCHNVPSDRALFSFDFAMRLEERLIANGELTVHEVGDKRRMKYETTAPLPVYQSAFAISEFEVEEGSAGGVPVSVWHRPGVLGDHAATVAEMERLMDMFEPLLGPYPFEQYSIVMLPEFSGGMENAGITFQSEVSTAPAALSAELIAHEFGHQWLGDAVTVASWDDLWIKEGMATLLGSEASRPYEDRSLSGTLFGDRFFVEAGYAARDKNRQPIDKYTTGPYDRGAWIFTQIRAAVGEEAFWGALRQILKDHLYGAVSTEEVITAFEPLLGEGKTASLRAAVDALDMPALEVSTEENTSSVTITLRDAQGILIAPLEVEWHRQNGSVERLVLPPDEAVVLAREADGDLLVLDPLDVHPDLYLFNLLENGESSYTGGLLSLTQPATPDALTTFSALPGIHQYAMLANVGLPPVHPAQWQALSASLHADSARATSLSSACALAAGEVDPGTVDAWRQTLTAVVQDEPVYRGLPYAFRPGSCGGLLDVEELFAPEWEELTSGLAEPSLSVERVFYLSTFDMPALPAIATWMPAAQKGYSLRARNIAARYVQRRARPQDISSPDYEGDLDTWRTVLIQLLAETDCSEVLRQLLPSAPWFTYANEDDRTVFLDQMRRILFLPSARLAHAQALCGAFTVLARCPAYDDLGCSFENTPPEGWDAFVGSLGGAPLSYTATRILKDWSFCL